MEELAVRVVTSAERKKRLCRLNLGPKRDILKVQTPLQLVKDEQMEEAHDIIFKGGFTKIETIQRAVLVEFQGVSMSDLKSRLRTAGIVKPRQIAMFLAKDMTNQSLPDIGRRFGGRDHTTVLHAVNKINRMARTDGNFKTLIDRIRKRIISCL